MIGIGVRLWGNQSSSSGALALIGAEPQGLAIDFTDLTMAIRDTVTPANTFVGDPNSKLTYSSPATKWILGANGLYSSGTALRTSYDTSGNRLGCLIEEARTNICLQSSDFTSASWVKTTLTAALTATGPDGTANSASTLTATAGNAMALQTIVSGSAARVTHVFLRRRTGSGNVDLTQDNGVTWTTQTLTASWARYALASVTSANPIVGIRLVTSGDAVDVAWFGHDLGAFATSPIPTTSASVTRAADNITLATSLFSAGTTGRTAFVNCTLVPGATTQDLIGLNGGGFAEVNIMIVGGSNVGAINRSGGVVQYSQIGAFSGGIKAALAVASGDVQGIVNSSLMAGGATATVPSVTALALHTINYIGSSYAKYIKQVAVIPRRMSNAELQTVTT